MESLNRGYGGFGSGSGTPTGSSSNSPTASGSLGLQPSGKFFRKSSTSENILEVWSFTDTNEDYEERDKFYTEISKNKVNPTGRMPGSCGLSAVMIAYDALLSGLEYSYDADRPEGIDYNIVVRNSCLHKGESDTTGGIALSW